jgi:hypothetical protein
MVEAASIRTSLTTGKAMSRTFAGIPVLPFIGQPFRYPLQAARVSKFPPSVVPISIDWNTPWQALNKPSQIGIQVNLQAQSTAGAALDIIKSIKIDNSNSTIPIYIQFADTQDVITCPPETIVTEAIYSNLLQFTVYAAGLTTGFIPTTRLQVCNVELTSNVDPEVQLTYPQWRGSPTIQRSNLVTPGFSSPALGDQSVMSAAQMLSNTVIHDLWGTPFAKGFIYLTNIDVTIVKPLTNIGLIEWKIAPADNSSILYQFYVDTSANVPAFAKMLNFSAMQLRLDATKEWLISGINFGGGSVYVQHAFNWTYNEN